MTPLIRRTHGLKSGYNEITHIGEESDTGIRFGVLCLAANQEWRSVSALETAYLLFTGCITISIPGETRTVGRRSVFEEGPCTLHLGPDTEVLLEAISDCELAVIETANPLPLAPIILGPTDVAAIEIRGEGMFSDSTCRTVWTVFDKRNRHSANLVLGETITPGGHWSSYPPHSHPHPEIYHYRFSHPCGYGHGEIGDQVYRVQGFDTLKIIGQNVHAQVAAPGYEMYYLWALRHLPDLPYTSPQVSAEHAWLLDTLSARDRSM